MHPEKTKRHYCVGAKIKLTYKNPREIIKGYISKLDFNLKLLSLNGEKKGIPIEQLKGVGIVRAKHDLALVLY